jgi:pseudouridine-5'-phosphate glycosidase
VSAYRTAVPPLLDESTLQSYRAISSAERDILEVLERRAPDTSTTLTTMRAADAVHVSVVYPRGGIGRNIIAENSRVEITADANDVCRAISVAHSECLGRINARLGVL